MTEINYNDQQNNMSKYSSSDSGKGIAIFGYAFLGIGVLLSILLIIFLA